MLIHVVTVIHKRKTDCAAATVAAAAAAAAAHLRVRPKGETPADRLGEEVKLLPMMSAPEMISSLPRVGKLPPLAVLLPLCTKQGSVI